MTAQKKNRLKAKISLALYNELGRDPSEQAVERFTLTARVLYKAVLGLHFERQAQKEAGQIRLF